MMLPSEHEKPPVIAVVTETYVPDVNGVASTLHHLVQGLIQKGICVQLIKPGPEDSQVSVMGLEVTTVKGFSIPFYPVLQFGLPAIGVLKRLWQERPPLVIYIATEGPLGWGAMKVAKKLDIPSVSGFHTNFHSYSEYYRIGWLKKVTLRYLRYLHNNTCATLVPTQCQQTQLQELAFNNVDVLSHGVDIDRFSPSKRNLTLRTSWGVGPNDLVCLYVGRLAKEKNIQLAIDSYRHVKKYRPKTRFVIVGGGPLQVKLESQYPDIIFTGTLQGEALAQHFSSSDIFLFPSRTETFGLVTLEAMASGLAVVAFDYAAAHQYIRQAHSGIRVSMDHDSHFMMALNLLIHSPDVIQKMKTQAVAMAQQVQWDVIVEQFMQKLLSHVTDPYQNSSGIISHT